MNMAYPTELIRRAGDQRRKRELPVQKEREELRATTERAPQRSLHGNYDRLMRKHDRLHPRHLDG